VNDAFPTDPTRAYINYFPAEKTYGTLAYEDQWPTTGDYDLNDLVVNYHYKIISNAQNNIVEFYADYVPIAAGATYFNGFGVSFPFNSAVVKTVSGQSLNNNYIKLNANGTEASQTNAVIIPFDNHSNLIRNPGNGAILNTDMAKAKMTGDTAHIYLQFVNPISKASFGNAPFNPFAISNQRRNHEVHLPGNLPTDLADKSLLGALQDGSNISSNIYYVTKDNHPWALSFLNGFSYPIEGVDISKAYLHFLDWANSGGTIYTDWYSNTGSGYRNTSNIYTK
jgi:LruC domain-containing protein